MRIVFTFAAALLILLNTVAAPAASQLHDFITVRGDQLMEGDHPFRFISFDIPNLLMIEDNMPFTETNPWRLPNQFEIRDALATLRQMGGTVARTYVLTVARPGQGPEVPNYVLGPGKFNERAFRTLDRVLQIANEEGVRLIIPLVDNWVWQGGRAEYAGFRGKTKDEFWTDPQLISDFEKTIHFVLTRTNTYTGVRYSDDPAILCWETGNELSSPPSWTRTIAAYIKSLDTNHLVMDGFNASVLRPESLTMSNIDIVTTHHYPGQRKSFAELIRENWAMAKGKKPYVVGEFGFVSTAKMEETMKAIMDTGMSGGLLWSLRFHDRDGGYYWHSEPSGGNLYKAFHWPGSPMGAAYDEIKLMALVRSNAFAIRGLTEPPVPVPAPPHLLPIADEAEISWQGSVGAANYTVERAPEENGPWTLVGPAIDESRVQYRPLFNDATAPGGEWYYRVRANNESGTSEPSNVVGPVKITHDTLVDELADFSQVFAKQGTWELKTHDCRKAKEDATRAAGNTGDELIYRLPTPIESFRVFVFFPSDVADLKFSVSDDSKTYRTVEASKESYFQGTGDYGYWKPVLYHAENVGAGAKFLKIELTGETQIGRVEITHALGNN
ncbi:MAG TPA: cellulase family glycosylhydrolase [Verrucomicrobiae bacterium]|nr:cellulase family glycosylhydrolase [Verrucomicrobiae bacterium]